MARRYLHIPLPLLSRKLHAPTPLFLRHAFSTSTVDTPASAVETPEAPEAAAAAPSPPRCEEPLHETILHMIRRRPWTTRLENSIRLLSPNLTAPLVHDVISAAAATGRAELPLQFFRFAYRRAGFRPESATFALLVPILASRRMLNHARCLLLDTMPSFSISPDEATVAALIAAYGKANIPQESVKLFRLMPELGITRTALSYNAVLKAILCRGREAMARRIYNAMIADGVSPDMSTYNTLIWGFGLCKKMEAAVRVFGDMKGHGVTPDVTTYNTLLNAWVRAGDLESARKVFDEMVITPSGSTSGEGAGRTQGGGEEPEGAGRRGGHRSAAPWGCGAGSRREPGARAERPAEPGQGTTGGGGAGVAGDYGAEPWAAHHRGRSARRRGPRAPGERRRA